MNRIESCKEELHDAMAKAGLVDTPCCPTLDADSRVSLALELLFYGEHAPSMARLCYLSRKEKGWFWQVPVFQHYYALVWLGCVYGEGKGPTPKEAVTAALKNAETSRREANLFSNRGVN